VNLDRIFLGLWLAALTISELLRRAITTSDPSFYDILMFAMIVSVSCIWVLRIARGDIR